MLVWPAAVVLALWAGVGGAVRVASPRPPSTQPADTPTPTAFSVLPNSTTPPTPAPTSEAAPVTSANATSPETSVPSHSRDDEMPTPASTPTVSKEQHQYPARPPPTSTTSTTTPSTTTQTTTTTTTTSPTTTTSTTTTTTQTPAPPALPLPQLPSTYEMTVEVLDIHNHETFTVTERENEGWASHKLTSSTLNVSCIFMPLKAEGYLLEGVKCGRSSRMPNRCFCTDRFCRPYISLSILLEYLQTHIPTHTEHEMKGVGGMKVEVWRASKTDMTIEAVYTRTRRDLTPLSFTVKGPGSVFMIPNGPIWLQYQVRSWALTTVPTQELVSTPPGVVCPVHERKFLPKLSNQFSLTMETVIQNLGTIAYESQHYEAEEKLVSFTYRPHLHADGMFLLNIPGLTDLTIETYRVIHDFKTGIQYMINEKTTNCSIQGIPVSALDAASAENQHIRLRHASELISIDPNMFFYKGTRVVRGILCDVWVAERGVRKGQYYTVEVFFSHENWTVEVEVFNKVRQVPIGISSYIADADNPSRWTSVVHTFFYEYRDGHPSWRHFDISPCLNRINRLFLILTLEVSYTELVHYNLEAAKNSIRRAVAGIAGVSPLRVTDMFLSSRQSTGEVDVWFVLLEKPDVTGPYHHPTTAAPHGGCVQASP
ncbi:hypothetical protein O3P69_001565 [Scylla paramamosain]|uniref:Uncharacterized protein n=2 Tax=Scylla paramamosain TaxID=85552 RepID=A0AAW0UY71_SCYPA